MASIFILFGLLLLANAYFFMKVRKKPGGNKIQVYRAQNGTTAAAHASGAIVDLIDSADDALIDFGDDFGFNELTSVFE